MQCSDCQSEVKYVQTPGVLDETFGPLGKHLFVFNRSAVMCPKCGKIGECYRALGPICDVIQTRLYDRRN